MALRTHIVGGRKTFGPVQTQRNHCGWVERYLEARSQALSAKVARVLLEESNHDFAETQHGCTSWPMAPSKRRTRSAPRVSRLRSVIKSPRLAGIC